MPPNLVALLDQLDAALRDVAGTLGDYRRELIAAGFPSDDALELCLDVQRAVIFGDRPTGGPPYID